MGEKKIGQNGHWARWIFGEVVNGQIGKGRSGIGRNGKKVGRNGNGRNGIGRNGNRSSKIVKAPGSFKYMEGLSRVVDLSGIGIKYCPSLRKNVDVSGKFIKDCRTNMKFEEGLPKIVKCYPRLHVLFYP